MFDLDNELICNTITPLPPFISTETSKRVADLERALYFPSRIINCVNRATESPVSDLGTACASVGASC
jgi:hypothetical protein